MMSRIVLLCVLLLLSVVSLGAQDVDAENQDTESADIETEDTEDYDAERFRMGIAFAAELAGEVGYDNFFENILDSPAVFPGVYWEVILNHLGFGMTCFGKFNKIEDGSSETTWEFDWIGSFDLRYHFTENSLFDPFAEFGIGCAGRVELPCCGSNSHSQDGELLMISVFFQAGGGIAVRLDSFHVGLKLLYRITNEPLPVTAYEVYPLYKLESVLFAGVSF
jgi:hypothetical protein